MKIVEKDPDRLVVRFLGAGLFGKRPFWDPYGWLMAASWAVIAVLGRHELAVALIFGVAAGVVVALSIIPARIVVELDRARGVIRWSSHLGYRRAERLELPLAAAKVYLNGGKQLFVSITASGHKATGLVTVPVPQPSAKEWERALQAFVDGTMV